MFTTLVSLALFSTLAIRGALADDPLTISSPAMNECQDVHITWGGGEAPFNLIVVPNDAPCDEVLVDLGDHSVNSLTWQANLTAGSQVLLSLQDNNGQEAWSNTITVGKSNDTSCLLANTTASASSSAPASSSTLVIPAGHLNAPSSAAQAPSSSAPAVPVGAVNAGDNPTGINGASAIHKLSSSVVTISVVAAVFAVSF